MHECFRLLCNICTFLSEATLPQNRAELRKRFFLLDCNDLDLILMGMARD